MGAGDEGGEKEFDPSQQRLRQLREQGNVPKSQDVPQLATLIVGVLYLVFGAEYIFEHISRMFGGLYGAFYMKTLPAIGSGYLTKYSVESYIMIMAPLLAIVSVVGVVANVGQTGFIFTTKPLVPDLNKFNPITKIKQIFGVRGLVELLKQIIKVSIIAGVAYRSVTKYWVEVIALLNAENAAGVMEMLKELMLNFLKEASIALIILTAVDFLYQRFQFTKDNRMTLKQVKDEYKQTEGDPFVKSQRRQMARRMMQRRQAGQVPLADFVTTNPHKIAVALKYKSGEMSAPVVLAKGADAFAWEIIAIAKRHDIPVIENVPLARALHRLVKVGREIPPELYRAVAEVLLFIYQVRGKAKFR